MLHERAQTAGLAKRSRASSWFVHPASRFKVWWDVVGTCQNRQLIFVSHAPPCLPPSSDPENALLFLAGFAVAVAVSFSVVLAPFHMAFDVQAGVDGM